MQDFEKLGVLYLGREIDDQTGQPSRRPLLYDSRDLTTHAVVVGMTGSGKTGLCLDLLEEAGLDRIPSIVIDPKGDISNLLLTFPDLTAEDFRPWIDESQASREGLSPEAFAGAEAEKWRQGLADWDQNGDRIRRFRDAVDLQVFTPGSNGGRPLTILKSFAAPASALVDDPDAFRERIQTAVSGLLALLGIEADPIRSREHILISNLLSHAWSQGRDLDLAELIGEIQSPPFQQVGVMELDTFFPPKERLGLAMTMNNLLASPSFASWLSGEPLDVKQLLHTDDGKPRISIMSIAHLGDAERMFFVTILLNEVLSWMRDQAGTSSLRAILYMDEVFGFFPPTANPPSKQPMLTMLKQARAFGLGVVLATQNPVDLDYKGLSNAGTWFLGRLQTERDQKRVIEGLEGATASAGARLDRGQIEKTLAGLGTRRFLMNNVHEDQPVVFETRWAMSYLRGPLTQTQIRRLTADRPGGESSQSSAAPPPASTTKPDPRPATAAGEPDPRQSIPVEIEQRFALPESPAADEPAVYQPAILATGNLHFVRATYQVDEWREQTYLVLLSDESPTDAWSAARELSRQPSLTDEPSPDAGFAGIPKAFQQASTWTALEKQFKDFLYRQQHLTLYHCKELKAYSRADETRGEFIVRLEQLASQKRDMLVDKLRKRYADKFESLQNRVVRAESQLQKESAQFRHQGVDSLLQVGSSILGAVLGRKTMSVANARRAESGMRSLGRASKQHADVDRAREKLQDIQLQMQELQDKLQGELDKIESKIQVSDLELQELRLPPRKGDLAVKRFQLVWLPIPPGPADSTLTG